MLGVGVILVLVGFALVVPRGGVPGAVAHRKVALGFQRVFSTPGYTEAGSSMRGRIIRVVIGLLLVIGGVALIAASG